MGTVKRMRPTRLVPAVTTVAALLLVAASCAESGGAAPSAPSAPAAVDEVAIYPIAGTRTANPATTISFRGALPAQLGDVTVVGSVTGTHDGDLRTHRDGAGVTFVPDQPFAPGEEVTVTTEATLVGGTSEASLTIAEPAEPPAEVPEQLPMQIPEPPLLDLATHPDFTAPEVTVEGDLGDQLLLVTPLANGAVGTAAMILDPEGELVWYRPAPTPDTAMANLVVDELDGEPVLTWFEGTAPYGVGRYEGEWVVVDATYTEIARIPGANGMAADLHDIELTDRGTAIIVIYQPVVLDLTDHGGDEDGLVLEAVVQEVDVATGDVHFEWHSLDHLDVDEARESRPGEADIVDYAHINSVQEGPDGDLLISLRHTSQIMEIDRVTGIPEWVLGGDAGTVDVGDDRGISFPHHARWLPDGRLSVFDNGVGFDPETSRGVVYELAADGSRAELVAEFTDDVFTATQGSVDVGEEAVWAMWSELGTATRYDLDGTPLGSLALGADSYRLFARDWAGVPAEPPVVVRDGDGLVVSWNGATEVAAWQVLAGPDHDRLEVVDEVAWAGFETTLPAPPDAAAVAVQAVDGAGEPLSQAVPVTA